MRIAAVFALSLSMVLGVTLSPLAQAEDPGPVVLTIDGATGDGKAHMFTLKELAALPSAGFETSTPWHTGPQRFDGVAMSDLMAAVAAKGKVIHVRALDDYNSDIPIADFARYKTLLAFKHNGATMPVRDKGPLFILYPFDSDPELRSETYYTRSPWQVAAITIE